MKRSREDVSPSEGSKEGDASPVEANRKKGEAAGGAAGDVDRRYEPIFLTNYRAFTKEQPKLRIQP